jgi:GntR family transcriptional regulator
LLADWPALPVQARRLRDLLRSDIVHGTYESGLLPSEPELMIAHGASRATVRGALALLRQEGAVTRRQGIGTVVTSHAVTTKLIEAHGIERPAARVGVSTPDVVFPQVLESSVIDCRGPIARLLGAPVGCPCARIEYLARVGTGINALCTNYVLFPEGRALLSVPFRTDWYSYLEQAGVEIGDDDFLISALAADDVMAKRLGAPTGLPLLFLEQVIRDPSGRPFNAAYLYLRTDRVMLLSHAAMPARGPTGPRPGGGS